MVRNLDQLMLRSICWPDWCLFFSSCSGGAFDAGRPVQRFDVLFWLVECQCWGVYVRHYLETQVFHSIYTTPCSQAFMSLLRQNLDLDC
ncbi:hypothetical protein BpHYR1_033690 [Brachionus plicatilis]|uniref:Uncharacterized protein n=1 Tax=Brachionus plicatilis TaxID=10195 RepID=A0A3M7PV32_BRAPC|nr:hypothetical protein BpHYR1_033690 [Brachionus plicatilis]